MADLTNVLNGPWEVPRPEDIPPEVQLMRAMDVAGLEVPEMIVLDGVIHRFNPDGKPRNKSGWYIAYPDGVVAGAFGDWKTGVHQRWCADIGRELTLNEKVQRDKRYDEAREAREVERSRLAEVVAETVGSIWESCAPASEEHPYLKRKGVLPHGARVSGDGRLVLPLYDEKDNLVTLQYIDSAGGKLYHKGGPTSGKYWTIGDPGKTIYMAEGFATAASIHEVTRQGVVIAYTASNLTNVAGLLREKYGPQQDVIIVADNDESGTGIREAEKAGNRWGMRIVMPPELGDANDYVQEGHDLLALLNPKSDGWLIQADEFCENPSPIRWMVKNWVQGQALQMVHGPSGCGKAQPLDEPVLTPSGWKPMGEIKPGDYVIGSKGFPVAVENVYPQGVKDVWEVEFSNGEVVRCCKDHLWEVKTSSESRSKILTTAELQHKPHRSYWQVPLCSPVSYARNYNPLPIDPYLLGCLLGDGGITAYVGFSSNDAFIVDEIKKRLPAGHEIRNKTGCDYQITSQRGQPNHIWTALRLLNLAGGTSEKKTVPDEYMVASPQDRLELLQGLMDTDGYVSAGNGTTCDFSNSSLILVEQVKELVQSLGGIANSIRCKKTSGLNCYTVTFRMQKGIIPFLLPRKAKRCCFNGNNLIIRVIDVRRTDKQAEMQCISLLSQDELYVTRGFIVTHNTFLVLDWCLRIAAGLPEWNGNRVREGSVVYLAGEGHYGLRGRVKAWKIHHGIDELSMWLSRDGCDLNKHPGYQLVADHIRALPVNPDVIVVDTLHRFLLGDENSAQDAREMLDACAKLMKEFSCTVILVHHTGVSEEAQHRARGSSAWRGALDIEVSVISAGPDDPIEVVQRKSKDSEITPPVWVELQKVDLPGWVDEDGEQVSSAVIVECNTPGRCKVDTKLAAHKKMFERAWFASGINIMDGKPYVARDKMLEFLVQNDGNSEATAKNMIKPSHTNRFIGYLINGEIIENTTDGWVVKDKDFTSALLIMR